MAKALKKADLLRAENQPEGEYCIMWEGAVAAGYGNVSYKGGSYKAHRLGFMLNNPDVDITGLVISHLCHNSLCIRATHLQATTQSENIKQSWQEGRRGSNYGRRRTD